MTCFDCSTDAFNHFAQDANFNPGKYRVLEGTWAKGLQQGKAVEVTIIPTYVGHSQRPNAIEITYSVGNVTKFARFHNEHQGKPRAKR